MRFVKYHVLDELLFMEMYMAECLKSCRGSKSFVSVGLRAALGVCSVLSMSALGRSSGAEDVEYQFSVDDFEDYIDSWIYVSVPGVGNYSLREVLEEGTPGWDAVASFGVPIDQYQPAYAFSTNPTRSNNGIVILIPEAQCLGDFNDDGVVNAADISLFLAAYVAGDLSADLTGNGYVDIFDQLLFLQLATMGCVSAA